MITKLFSRPPQHEHSDPAQRIASIAELSPESQELAHLLLADPVAEVRAAAAERCTALSALLAAWRDDNAAVVKSALAATLPAVLAGTPDEAAAGGMIESAECPDAMRVEVARRSADAQRRAAAIRAIQDEEALIDLALSAEHAETRLAAAERVHSPAGLRRLAELAKTKDRGVARLARQRVDAIENDLTQLAEADAILAQLEALPDRPGPILTELIELNRRWHAAGSSAGPERTARWDAGRARVQARLYRDQDQQRSRIRFDRHLADWLRELRVPDGPQALTTLLQQLDELRAEARHWHDAEALAALEAAAERLSSWGQQLNALADAEKVVLEAEQRAASDAPDDGVALASRWRALDAAARTPELSARYEAALLAVEQRRLAQDQAVHQRVSAARQQLHALLHSGEQALAAGQLQKARTAADEIKAVRAVAGLLPKPTLQRMGRLIQQLTDLEKWESFGQHNARVRLCERAEAVAAATQEPARIAQEVQALRNEWKALDQQHAGVPRGLWERFDAACRKAYAPAAKHFAEMAAQRKQARAQREKFIEAASLHAPTLLNDPRDWRAIERWLRDTENTWREGNLGSVEPGVWKELDGRLKTVLSPLRTALAGARDEGKTARQALIAEVSALIPRATERDAVSQVKAIQGRWQQQAKALPLSQRDERPLWEQFRAACDAVFEARQAKRKEDDKRGQERRSALAELCGQMEQLAKAGDKSEQDIKRTVRGLQDEWAKAVQQADAGGAGGLEARFRSARAAVEQALSARSRSREAAGWQTLADKEQLCETLDRLVVRQAHQADAGADAATVNERWAALPPLSKAWEQALATRRDAALRALAEPAAARDHAARIDAGRASRRERLLELEIMLGVPTPPELQADKRALQVKQLRERFSSAAAPSAASAAERLVAWCAEPGIAEELDRQRVERLFARVAQPR